MLLKPLPYLQAIRYRRIIAETDLLDTELTALRNRFVVRGYPVALLDFSFDKAKLLSRQSTLQYKDTNVKRDAFNSFLGGRTFLPLIITYHSLYDQNNLRKFINESWQNTILEDENLNTAFNNELPQIVYKRGKTLANVLTSTKFAQSTILDQLNLDNINILQELEQENNLLLGYNTDPNSIEKVNQCNHVRCGCFHHLAVTSTFYNSDKTSSFNIPNQFNYNSKDLVYIVSCAKCNKLYVGQTTWMLKERLNNHRSDIKSNKNTAVSKHFNDIGHALKDLRITPIFSLAGLALHERFTV